MGEVNDVGQHHGCPPAQVEEAEVVLNQPRANYADSRHQLVSLKLCYMPVHRWIMG